MPASLRVLLTDRAWPDFELEREILGEIGAEVVEAPDSAEETLAGLAADVDGIGTCWAQVTAAVIAAAPRCRVIGRFGIGLDNIDVEEATRRSIPVTYVPDYCVPEVTEHTLALVFAAARKVAFFHAATKAGDYQLQAGLPLRRLAGQVLGLVGLGRIGRSVAGMARAIGFEVIAHTPSGDPHETGCEMVDLETLLVRSDFVSLHAPLNESTAHLIGPKAIASMKPSAWLINTSRGGLVDHDAVWQALQEDRLGGAALDVFDPEPPDLDRPLFRHERVIVTPHAAFLSEESLLELRTRATRQIVDVLRGRRPEHVANPQACEGLSERSQLD